MSDLNVPKPPRGRHLGARESLIVIGLATLILLLFEGTSVRNAGEEMNSGVERTIVLAVGKPAASVAEPLPFDDLADDALSFLSPDDELADEGGFDEAIASTAQRGIPPVTPEQFDAAALGERAPSAGKLETLLVTGDSLVMPLDAQLARRLADDGVEVVRDAHVGTGISKSTLLDWGKLSAQQVRKSEPDAVVIFIGANEGFSMPGAGGRDVECCGPEWAAAFATRVRRMMSTYRQDGVARVYWLLVPLPRDGDRQDIDRSVNAAIEVAAQPWRSDVRVLDMVGLFTPGDRYTDSIELDGRKQIVRDPDGIHLNERGSGLAADAVLEEIDRDFDR